MESIFNNIRIAGIAACVPEKQEDVQERFGPVFGEAHVAKFIATTGVQKRYVVRPGQNASDLGFAAAKRLLAEKGVDQEAIGALLFVSQTPDYPLPATAHVLHAHLELPRTCACADVNLGCSGYVYGLQMAASMLACSTARYALVVGADALTPRLGPKDASACMLFGDAGTATLLEKCEGAPEMRVDLHSDGTGYKAIMIPAGGARKPIADRIPQMGEDGNERSDADLYMNGTEVFTFTISQVPALINAAMQRAGTTAADYDALVLHQANAFIFKQIAKRVKFPMDKLLVSLDQCGNTSVASIPLSLVCCREKLPETARLLLCGFGVGLSLGVVDAQVTAADVLPLIQSGEIMGEETT